VLHYNRQLDALCGVLGIDTVRVARAARSMTQESVLSAAARVSSMCRFPPRGDRHPNTRARSRRMTAPA